MTKKPTLRMDLNSADEAELVQKLNISARLARRIIALRPYRSVDDLSRVWGLEEDIRARISPFFTVEAAPLTPEEPQGISDVRFNDYQKSPWMGQNQGGESAPNRGESAPNRDVPMGTPLIEEVQATAPLVQPLTVEVDEAWGAQAKSLDHSAQPLAPAPKKAAAPAGRANLILILILLAGAFFRFSGINWDQNMHQHPDERFVTMVAEQIRGVSGLEAYFNTATSTLNPLKNGSYTYGMLPLFLTRMVAEWMKMTAYDPIVLVGRGLSGLFDLAAVWMLYLLGTHLYNRRTGLLAAGLAAAAVLPIQLSHYFAVDSFSTVFVVASVYFALQAVPLIPADGKVERRNLVYFAIFGLMVGLAGACKVNTLPIFGVIVLAGAARLAGVWKKAGFRGQLGWILAGWGLALLAGFLAFRVLQPYAFAGPGFFGLALNQRWLEVIKEVTNQVAGNSEWPPNHHWTSRVISYAWTNMVMWGMGLPLGLAGWLGWGWAAWRMWKGDWRRHFLQFSWVLGYFLWQNAQFWRYMRYFLPVYPFIILFAAWALLELYDRTRESRARLLAKRSGWKLSLANLGGSWQGAAVLLAMALVIGGSYLYAFAFTRIYTRPLSRVVASQWILQNIGGPLNVRLDTPQGAVSIPLQVKNRAVVIPGEVQSYDLVVHRAGSISSLSAPNVSQVGLSIYFRLSEDENGDRILTEGRQILGDEEPDTSMVIPFGDLTLAVGHTYYFHYQVSSSSVFSLSGVSLHTENPDEPSIPIDWSTGDQNPGSLSGVIPFQSPGDLRLNRFEIREIAHSFSPSQSTLKVSLFADGQEATPLFETTQDLDFSSPGQRLAPVFNFSPVKLAADKLYRLHYEVSSGGPLNLGAEAYTLETSWDDALPLSVDQTDALGGIYLPLNLELYEPDTPAKREEMLKILEQVRYIVIPSNRAYDAMPRLPLRYPMTLKYYQALFDCACSGDALENRAYQLTAPFKSPLGFELVKTFDSNPSLGPLTINDQSADESFTVYDHPKVLIFKKSADFSIEKVKAILNSVDLDQVIFQTPMAYTRAPNALALPADRLAAQTAGGSWAEMFKRGDWVNAQPVLGIIAWYLFQLLLGWMVFPLLFMVCAGLPDRGYPLMRIAGLVLTAWLAWMVGSLKILPFTRATLAGCVLLLAVGGGLLAYRRRAELLAFLRQKWAHILVVEAVFLGLFLFSLWVRLGNPDLWQPWLGGEKPMDFTFFNGVIKAVYFPPENPWFAGHALNYYYYGYVLAAVPTKLLGILPSAAFNLVLPSWFAMTGLGLFSLGYNLVAGLGQGGGAKATRDLAERSWWENAWRWTGRGGLPYLAGVAALVSVLLLGNLYMVRQFWNYLPDAPAEQLVSPFDRAGAVFSGALKVLSGDKPLPGDKGRWYFEASRPILHEGPDTPIVEFPYFTFLYADLHPHLLSMPVYSLALSWMLGVILLPLRRRSWFERGLGLVLGALILGFFSAAHTWDFPTFLGLGLLVVLWDTWRGRPSGLKESLAQSGLYGLACAGMAVLFYSPFAEWFRSEYAAVEIWNGLRTPLGDYLFVFGLPLFVLTSLLVLDMAGALRRLWGHLREGGLIRLNGLVVYAGVVVIVSGMVWLWSHDYQVLAASLPYLAALLYLIFFKPEMPVLRRVIWLLFAAGLGLTLLVEVVVLKGDVGRSNTVFRFYNQAWLLIGLAASVSVWEIVRELPAWPLWRRSAWLTGLALLVLGAACYPLIATGKKMADRWPDIQNPPHALDGSLFMLGESDGSGGQIPAVYKDENRPIDLSQDFAAIQYVQEHVSGSPVIVEANTPEYRWGSRFSIYTGLPSVVGWSWHTRQHNSLLDGALIDRRINAIADFYNTSDVDQAVGFLKRYQVRYIIVGGLERIYYPGEGLAKFQQMQDAGRIRLVFGDNSPETTSVFEVVQ